MTLHTRVMVTTPGVDARAAFDKMRGLIGADDTHTFTSAADGGWSMDLGQGLPALMWVDPKDGQPEACDEWCEPDCSRRYHDPAGWLLIHFDTAYGYTASNGASCSDLHAWLLTEIGMWLTERGAEWVWYDESGCGWRLPDLNDLGTLGDPVVGRLGSTVQKVGRDPKRDFGALAMLAIAARFSGQPEQGGL